MAYSGCGPIICHKRDCDNPQYFVKLKIEEELLARSTNGRYELDYVEEEGGRLVGYECKWKEKRWQPPSLLTQMYPGSDVHLVHSENYLEFLT